MVNLRHILIGWGKHWGILPSSLAEEKLSKLRLEICKRCTRSKRSRLLELIDGDLIKVDTLVCTKCGCPCKQKTMVVEETCPIRKW